MVSGKKRGDTQHPPPHLGHLRRQTPSFWEEQRGLPATHVGQGSCESCVSPGEPWAGARVSAPQRGRARMTPAALPTRQSAPRSPGGGFTGQPQPLRRKRRCDAKLCRLLLGAAPAPQGAGWVPKGKAQRVLPTLAPLPCHPPGTQSTGLTCPDTIPVQTLCLAPRTAAQGIGRAQPPRAAACLVL